MSENHESAGNRLTLRVGFFSVLPHHDGSYLGGYLVLNGVGRPLEFHCTTPVKPTRSQEILYGPTLKPYLFGEQIGPALLGKSKTTVHLVCVSQWEALTLAEQTPSPVALVIPEGGTCPTNCEPADCAAEPLAGSLQGDQGLGLALQSPRSATACLGLPPWQEVWIGQNRLAVVSLRPESPAEVVQTLAPWAETLDLVEPFERIRAAIEETSRRG